MVKILDSLKLLDNCPINQNIKSLFFACWDFFFFCSWGVAQESLGSLAPSPMNQAYRLLHRVICFSAFLEWICNPKHVPEIYFIQYPDYGKTGNIIRVFESILFAIYRETATQYLHRIPAQFVRDYMTPTDRHSKVLAGPG